MNPVDPFDDPFDDPDMLLLIAVHRNCGRTVATYWHRGGWYVARARCRCTPRPELPTGAALRRALATVKWGGKPRKKKV